MFFSVYSSIYNVDSDTVYNGDTATLNIILRVKPVL